MGIVTRFKDIMESNINALLDKCEDPSKMVDQQLVNLRKDLAQVKVETAGVMADAKAANRKVDECQANIDKYNQAAINAVKAGKDDDARQLLAKKQQYEQQMVKLQQNAALANTNADKMRQMHDKLVSDIDSLETRKDTIKATEATAKAQDRMNKMVSGGTKAASSLEAFERMEAKANKHLDAAMAEADLNAGNNAVSDLAEKYAGGGNTTSVDAELDALKASLGM